ncbi:MAG TPA: SMC-Scp complex subunit ScpB [Terriglobales bacterium]|nr:SMC-Scp complex subunit ScpB [Terriglobales bacterium]
MSLKPKLEALIYAAEEPVTLDQLAALLKDDLLALREQPRPVPDPENAEQHLGAVEDEAAVSSVAEAESKAEAPSSKAAKSKEKSEKAELRALLKPFLEELIAEYNRDDHGIEIRQVAGGYRMSTKPEHHDVVRAFSKSLKPPVRLSLQALETLSVIAYKQPVTVPEINDIRGVDSSGVIGTLLDRKLITTAGRKAVVGRPMLYRTSKDFLLRFGLRDLNELPSLEEFEKLAAGELQEELLPARDSALPDATGVPHEEDDGGVEQMAEDKAETPENITEPTVSSDPRHNRTDEEVAGEVASESKGG